MPIDRARGWGGLAVVLAAALLPAACNQDDTSRPFGKAGLRARLQGAAAASEQDPCSLLAAGEAEPYIGKLGTPPYRGNDDGAAAVHGDACLYDGSDGRQLSIKPTWRGGKMMGTILTGVPKAVGGLLAKDALGMDSMTNRVMHQGPAGPWDQTTWIPGGTLFVVKGDAQVAIDMSGSTGRQSDALALAKEIVPRIGHPLDYDGAKAVAMVPKPKPHPANPCDLLSQADVEAAIGPLEGAPIPDSAGMSCTYKVHSAEGERTYPVGYAWQGGRSGYNRLKHGMAMMGEVMGAPASTPLDTLTPNADMKKVMGGLMKMVGGNAAAAPGAMSTVGMKTDTTLQGPWDNASLLHGTQLIAVKGDVEITMTLESADYEKAKALLTAICSKL